MPSAFPSLPAEPSVSGASASENDPSRTWIQPHYAAFDGLRAVAVCLVFLVHYADMFARDWLRFTAWGWIGVDLFFVLSGFLISGILFDSMHAPDYFRNFYVRRALRIFPIFYGFFLLLLVLTPVLHLQLRWSTLGFVFYAGNLMVPFCNVQFNDPTIVMQTLQGRLPHVFCNLGFLWSLCVEEQFYLIWPAVIYLIRDRKKLMWLCGCLILATFVFRSAERFHLDARMDDYPMMFYFSTYFRCDDLLIGSFVALGLRGVSLSTATLHRVSNWLMCLPGAVFFFGIYRVHHVYPDLKSVLNSRFVDTVGFTLLGLACAGVLLRTLDETSLLSRILQLPALQKIGKISYGIYFYHMLPKPLVLEFAGRHPALGGYIPFIVFAATLLTAYLSFRYYETAFLNLKPKAIRTRSKAVRRRPLSHGHGAMRPRTTF